MAESLLDVLDGEERRLVLAAGRRRSFARREVLFHRGDPGESVHFVTSGSVAVYVVGRAGSTVIFDVFGPGEAVGEMALIDRSARSATVKAETEVRGYQLPVWSFRPLIESHPEVVWPLLEALAQRVRAAESRNTQAES